MSQLVRKRISLVFHPESSEDESQPPSQEHSSPTKTKPSPPCDSLVMTKISSGANASQQATLSSPDRKIVTTRDSLELVKSTASLATSPRSAKSKPRTTLRSFTASTLQKLSERIRANRKLFYSEFSGNDGHESSSPSKIGENHSRSSLSIRSKFSIDTKQRQPKREKVAVYRGPSTLSTRRSYGFMTARDRQNAVTRRLSKDSLSFDSRAQRRKSESDAISVPLSLTYITSVHAPQIELDFPQPSLMSEEEEQANSNTTGTTRKVDGNDVQTGDATCETDTQNKDSRLVLVKEKTASIPSVMSPAGRSTTATEPFTAARSLSRARGTSPFFFQGKPQTTPRFRNPSPLRRQMGEKINTDISEEMEETLAIPEPQEDMSSYNSEAKQSECFSQTTTGVTTAASESPQQHAVANLSRFKSCDSSASWDASTASDSSVTPDLKLQRCRARRAYQSPSPEIPEEESAACTIQAGNVHHPQIHRGPLDLVGASSALISNFSIEPTQTSREEDISLPLKGKSLSRPLSQSGLRMAVEAIERRNGSNLGDETGTPSRLSTALSEAMDSTCPPVASDGSTRPSSGSSYPEIKAGLLKTPNTTDTEDMTSDPISLQQITSAQDSCINTRMSLDATEHSQHVSTTT